MSSTNDQNSAQEANSPGWKLVKNRWLWSDGKRYTHEWDGTQYVALAEKWSDPAGPIGATITAKVVMPIVVLAGVVVIWWGSTREEYETCESDPGTRRQRTLLIADGLWLPWFILLGLAAIGFVMWRKNSPNSDWVKFSAILGVSAAVLLFPVWGVAITGANCGL
jgi:hypothetical protein